ncbi:MAG: META domain-containing protein [Alphaproteobacteria bacterium]|nr:META domain-containing protein [Alphaproteobacteria bacterium]
MKPLLTLLAALILASCTAGNAPAAPPLAGSQWVLKAMSGWEMGKAPQVPTLNFQSDTQVGGRGGCNSWGGSYELKGTSVRFGQMRSTLMACAYGMDVETRFHEMLREVRTLTVAGDTLTLGGDGGGELATFFRASAAVPP